MDKSLVNSILKSHEDIINKSLSIDNLKSNNTWCAAQRSLLYILDLITVDEKLANEQECDRLMHEKYDELI